jgi:hypothetical protein
MVHCPVMMRMVKVMTHVVRQEVDLVDLVLVLHLALVVVVHHQQDLAVSCFITLKYLTDGYFWLSYIALRCGSKAIEREAKYVNHLQQYLSCWWDI